MPTITLSAKRRNDEFLRAVAEGNPGAEIEYSPDGEKIVLSCPDRLVIRRRWADDAFPGQGGRCSQTRWDGLLLHKNKKDRVLECTVDMIILEDEEIASRSRAKPGEKMFQARLSLDLYKRLEVAAAHMDLSMAEVARRAISAYLDELEVLI